MNYTVNNNYKKPLKFAGFTLVELIVVITILVILGTIAFMNFGGYSLSARDSTRVSDMNNIQKGLEFTRIKMNVYPDPTNGVGVTFAGGNVWTQGTIGDSVMSVIRTTGFRFSKKPTDPKYTNTEYTYALLENKKEYQVTMAMEGGAVTYNPIIPQAYAANTTSALTAYIAGSYNGLLAKSITGSTTYYLALPSITLGDVSSLTLRELTNTSAQSGNLILNNKKNIPSNYKDGGALINAPSITFSAMSNSDKMTSGTGIVAYVTNDLLDSTTAVTMMTNLFKVYATSNLKDDSAASSKVSALMTQGSGNTALAFAYNTSLGASIGSALIINTSSGQASPPPVPAVCNPGENGDSGVCKDPYWSNVVLALHGEQMVDTTSINVISPQGNTRIDNIKSKFGGSSYYFDGAGDVILIPDSTNFDFGTGSFTMDMWVNTDARGSYDRIIAGGTNSDGGFNQWFLGAWPGAQLNFGYQNGGYIETSANLATWNNNEWHHVAVTRQGTNVYIFWNGILKQTWNLGANTPINTGSYGISIGGRYHSQSLIEFFHGNIDDLRITKGVARYTSNFTLPIQAFANQ